MDDYLYNMNRLEEQLKLRNSRTPSYTSEQNPEIDERLSQELRRAISSTRQFFFNHQHPDGYWVGELEGDALLQSETIMLLAFLGEEDSSLAKECSVHLLETQLDDGGWGMYTGGQSDVCNTVKAYFALKLTGHDPSADYMQKARVRALELGGADCVNSFTRFYLALLGQIPYDACPVVPPQMILLPKRFPVNIYSMSSWSRTIFIPLSIVSALAPVQEIPFEKGIRELFVKEPKYWPKPGSKSNSKHQKPTPSAGKNFSCNPFSWDRFFRLMDGTMKFCRRIGLTPCRKRAIERAKEWTLEHCKRSDGPGAIYPPIVWTWIALKALGYADDSKEIEYCRRQLNDLVIRNEKKGSARIQPCKSPVWDTSLTLKSLMLGGLTTSHPSVRKGVQWIRSRHIKEKGDWSETVDVAPGAWCFEFNNDFYPDCDDTAMALMVLAGRFDEAKTALPKIPSAKQQKNLSSVLNNKDEQSVQNRLVLRELADNRDGQTLQTARTSGILPPDLRLLIGENGGSLDDAKRSVLDLTETTEALEGGLRWLLAMQNKDGGWAAFDYENNKSFLCKIPFADHNAMIDPSTPDLTGRVLESLGRLGFRIGQNAEADRAVRYMKNEQQADGSWFGRWGVNYIYGTWQALTGLTAVGVPINDPSVEAGANWLLTHQHSSGGWGESPDSYEDPSSRGRGKPTASQTAWAVMGLIAAGLTDHPAVYRGIRFLLDRQRNDGTWYEAEYTGTGFPTVFYLKYHYYSVYFPLMALSLYAGGTKIPNLGICEEETILRMQKVRVFSPETAFYNNARPEDKPEEFIVPETSALQKSTSEKPNDKPSLRVFFG